MKPTYIPTINGFDITLWVFTYLAWRYLAKPRGCAQQAETPAPLVANMKTRLWQGFSQEGGGLI
jgi:hypothetical protein